MTIRWVTREEWGARQPLGRRTDVGPKLGVALHWPGPGRFANLSHDKCAGIVRGWQNQHMASGFSNDIQYGLICCTHGFTFEARQEQDLPIIRVGSNGTYNANSQYGSVQLMRGADDPPPTADDITVLGEAVAFLRHKGWGPVVVPHSVLFPTACCGDGLRDSIPAIKRVADGEDDSGGIVPPVDDEEIEMYIVRQGSRNLLLTETRSHRIEQTTADSFAKAGVQIVSATIKDFETLNTFDNVVPVKVVE